MENIKLFIIRLILASVVLGIVVGKKITQTDIIAQENATSPSTAVGPIQKPNLHSPNLKTYKHLPKNKRKKDGSKIKKAKRDAYAQYRKSWSRSSNFGYGEYSSNLPLYLVFNRKMGAYYPFYKYPKESQVRRGNNVRRLSQPVRPAM